MFFVSQKEYYVKFHPPIEKSPCKKALGSKDVLWLIHFTYYSSEIITIYTEVNGT